jgi:cell division protease FtsH
VNVNREHQIDLGYVFIAALLRLAMRYWIAQSSGLNQIPSCELPKLAGHGKVSDISVGHSTVSGTINNPGPKEPDCCSIVRVEPEFAQILAKDNVNLSGVPAPGLWLLLVSWIMPTPLFFLIWMFVIRYIGGAQGASGLMSIGKSKAKIHVEKDIKVPFADVAGIGERNAELAGDVAFLKNRVSHGQLHCAYSPALRKVFAGTGSGPH